MRTTSPIVDTNYSRIRCDIRKEPIVLNRICLHQSLVNSSALEFAGITEQTANPFGGEIGKDQFGKLNGRLLEKAKELLDVSIPKEGEAYIDYLENAMELAIKTKDMHSKGLTGAHSKDMSYFGHYLNPLTAYRRVIGKKRHFRVHLLRHVKVFEEMMKDGVDFDEPFIDPGAMKMFADGALGRSPLHCQSRMQITQIIMGCLYTRISNLKSMSNLRGNINLLLLSILLEMQLQNK
ncbi:hypothetical protein UACE39S_02752 [Ureibacillus acetophenoni]